MMAGRYGRLRTALERSIRAAVTAGTLNLDRQAALLCSARYQADMIDDSKGKVNYNDWRTFNSTCSMLGFDPMKAGAKTKPVSAGSEPDGDNDLLAEYG